MRDLSASNVSHVSRKPLQCIRITTPHTGHIVEVTFQNHAMPMICSLIERGFLTVFSIEGKVMLYSKIIYFEDGHIIKHQSFRGQVKWFFNELIV